MRRGFTLVELMIVVFIIAIVSVVGGITLSSRMKTSRLESAAQSLAADLSYARTAALFKGCHTRFILCGDPKCTDRDVAAASAGGPIQASGQNVRYYAILRRAQYTTLSDGCYFDPADTPDPSPASGGYFDQWDFDRKPRSLPQGIVLSGIYSHTGNVFNGDTDWSTTTAPEAGNSLYFNASPNALTPMVIPVDDSTMAGTLGEAVFQVTFEDCNPDDAGEDCTAYIISITSSGETNVTQCEPGTRTDGSNICF